MFSSTCMFNRIIVDLSKGLKAWKGRVFLSIFLDSSFTGDLASLACDSIWRTSRENRPYGLCRCHTKRRMGTRGHAHPSFGMSPTFREYDLWSQQTQILKSRCHTKRRMGAATRVHPSFGMTTTKALRSGFSWRASIVFVGERDFHCINDDCVHFSKRCDGVDDCGDNSDELKCNTATSISVM